MSNYYRSILNVQAVVPLDLDAQAYINAVLPSFSNTWFSDRGITENVWKMAVNNAFIDLKTNSLYSKIRVWILFCGGTAESHKYNAVDPRDLNAAFRLEFFGSPTHNADGTQGNGSSQYFNTFFNTSTDLSSNNLLYDINMFSQPNTINNAVLCGNLTSPGANSNAFILTTTDPGNSFRLFSSGSFNGTLVNKSITVGRNGNNVYRYVNDSFVSTLVETPGTRLNANVYGLAANLGGTATNHANVGMNWFLIGEGFSNAEISTLITIRNTFLTAIGR
jgi:hypothetical protein